MNNNIELFEKILVCVIVLIQILVFTRTFFKIRLFRRIIPDVDFLSVTKLVIPITDLEKSSPDEILQNKDNYKNGTIPDELNNLYPEEESDEIQNLFAEKPKIKIEKTEVNIIENDSQNNEVFREILFSLNNYLIRNRGAASDFNLLKDIVERNTDTVEEDINLTISIPLYLGLMGTMIGIVIALFNMPDIGMGLDVHQTGETLNRGISVLIGGVKIAMIASFIGLGLTIINSGWIFKGSRRINESKKNELYTFIQIELLPIINQGLASTLDSLQRNLLGFNQEFSNNLKNLTGVFDSNKEAMQIQKDLIETLDKTKVAQMTRYNVQVLQELNTSVEKFEKFNSYMTNVTQFVENSQLIVSRTNELLARTDNFKTIAENLEDKLTQSQQLLNFLSEHFNKLEAHKEFTQNTVADVGFSISETFKELKTHIETSSEAVKQFTVDETDALKSALSESRTNLSNLEYLANLKTDVSQFKNSSASQGERMRQAVDELNENLARSIAILEHIEKRGLNGFANNSIKSIKNLFKSKN